MPRQIWCPSLAAAGVLAVAIAAPVPLRAANVGSIDGTVLDARGRAIHDAALILTGKRGGGSRARTNASGFYRIPAENPAQEYVLRVDAKGYRSVAYDGVRLTAGRTIRFNVRLKRPGERDVVVLLSRDPYPFDDLLRGILQNLDAPTRTFDLDAEEDPGSVLRRLEAERPNLILGSGLLAARLVRREIRDIPAVMGLLGDPRLYDLEAVNLTYLTMNSAADELIRRVRGLLPKAVRMGLLYDARVSTLVARDLRQAAHDQGFTSVITRPCYEPTKIAQALDDFTGKVDVVIVPSDPLSLSEGATGEVTRWALQQRVALIGPGAEWVRRGALFSYGPTNETLGRDLSYVANHVLEDGFQAEDPRLIGPLSSVLTVNRNTALALGVEVPGDLMVDASY